MSREELNLYLKRALAFRQTLGLAFREPGTIRYLEGRLVEISHEELIIATAFGAVGLHIANLVMVDGNIAPGASELEIRLARGFLPGPPSIKGQTSPTEFEAMAEDFIKDLWEDKISPDDFCKP